jgi:hypothetical protein
MKTRGNESENLADDDESESLLITQIATSLDEMKWRQKSAPVLRRPGVVEGCS